MPSATIITSTGPRWGNSGFSSSAADLKVGKSGTSSYYGYVGFPRLNPAWYIKSIRLRMKREDAYSTKVLQFGSNRSNAWGDKGILDWAKDYSVPSGTGTKEWDLSAYKAILQGYAGTWYLQVRHGSGDNSYCEFSGGTGSSAPRLVIEYEEASLSVPGEQFTIGITTDITVGNAGSGLTHRLSYAIGAASGVIAEDITAGAPVNWTPDAALAAQITDAMAGTVTLTLESYLAGALSSTLTFAYTLHVQASYAPTISEATFALLNPIGDAIGLYVQGRSRTICAISATAPGGASIREYRLTLAGKTYASTFNEITSDVLTATGALTATVEVVDSRGQVAALTEASAVTVQPYTAPMITSFSVARCLVDGTLSNGGAYIKYALSCAFSALSNMNTRAGSIMYKVSGGTFSIPVSLTGAMTALGPVFSFTLTGVLGSGDIGSGGYVVSASLTDRYTTATDEAELASRTIWFDLHGSGEGVAIGKVAETAGLFDVGLPSRFRIAAQFDVAPTFSDPAAARANLGASLANLGVRVGTFSLSRSTWAAGTNYPYAIAFDAALPAPPTAVLVGFLRYASGLDTYTIGTTAYTATGFTFNIARNAARSAATDFTFVYIAV